MEFVELAYKRLEERWLTTRDYIEWATQLLEEGSDAPSVAELASCYLESNPDKQQVERIFQSCLIELGLTLPLNWHQALLAYASSICKRTVNGTLQPWDCVREMLQLSDDSNEPYILWIWIDLARNLSPGLYGYEEYSEFNHSLDVNNQDESIRRTAVQFVSLCSVDLPDKFPFVWWCQKCHELNEETTFTGTISRTCPTCGSVLSMKNMRFFENREAYVSNALP